MAGSIIAGIATGLVNNALSQENAQQQRDWQERMYHLQNKYNHPAAMADRMREAGLNPYTMTGAEPAASVGTGAAAQTIPLQNPFESLLLASQIQKTNAETGLLGGQAHKVNADWLNGMAQLALAGQEYQMGVISLKEYEARVNKYLEWLENNNPFQIEGEHTAADTNYKNKLAGTEEARKLNLEALTQTENELREYRKTVLDMQADEIEQAMTESRQRVREIQEDIEAKGYENNIAKMQTAISRFFRTDISVLPPNLQYKAARYMRECLDGEYTYQSTIDAFSRLVNEYINKETHIQYSESEDAGSVSINGSALGLSFGASRSSGSRSRSY